MEPDQLRYFVVVPFSRPMRHPCLELSKRRTGLLLSAMIVCISVHPVSGEITSRDSPLPRGMARWDVLAFALFGVVSGYLLFTRAEKSVEPMLTADRSNLEDQTTLRLWTFEVQTIAILFLLWSLLPMVDFIRSFAIEVAPARRES